MNNITVLMTGAGAPGAYGIIRCFRNNTDYNFKIIGVDANPDAGCRELVDHFEVVPMASDDNFISAILSVCEKYDVDVIQPIVTRELQKFSDNKKLFNSIGVKVCVEDPDKLRIINNKGNLFEYLSCFENFNLPKYKIVHSITEYEKAMDDLDWRHNPICIKATFGNGSRGIRFVDNRKSLYDLFMKEKPDSKYISYRGMMDIFEEADIFPELMVMQFLPGREYGVDVLADKGKVICIASRYSSVVKNSIPMVSEIIDNHEVEEQCKFIVEHLGLSGNIGFDFRCDENGFPYLMEINPRLTATVVLNAVAGINFPCLGVLYALGESIDVHYAKIGVQLHRRYEESYYDSKRRSILSY